MHVGDPVGRAWSGSVVCPVLGVGTQVLSGNNCCGRAVWDFAGDEVDRGGVALGLWLSDFGLWSLDSGPW